MTAPARRRSMKSTDKPRPYHWFKGASVRALYDEIGRLGPDNVRLEVRTEGREMTFTVVGEEGEVSTETHAPWHTINDSHYCPPDC